MIKTLWWVNTQVFPRWFMGSLMKEAVRHQELSQWEPFLLIQWMSSEGLQSMVTYLHLSLSSDLDNDIGGCVASAAQEQNRPESVYRQTKTQGIKPDPRANQKMQCKRTILNKTWWRVTKENRKKCWWFVSYPGWVV